MKSKKYVTREHSWLSFNGRVLQEAADPKVPLLERLKFLGIYSSNLDEFFSVRVGNLQHYIDEEKTSSILFGQKPEEVLKEVLEIVHKQHMHFDEALKKVQDDLRNNGIFFIDETQLSKSHQAFVKKYFATNVRPRLVPIMLDNIRKFPYLKNCVIYLLVTMSQSNAMDKQNHALIEVPADVLPRFISLPSSDSKKYVIMLDDIIRFHLKDIFKILEFDHYEAFTLKITRDAEYDLDDDIRTSMFEKIAKSVKSRESGDPVRLIYDKKLPQDFLQYIVQQLKLTDYQSIIPGNRYHNARDMINFAKSGEYPQKLTYKPILQLEHPDFNYSPSMFKCIQNRDILLQYPYHSFHNFIDLLREAAIDPKVRSIKMTIYRLANQSDVVNALINAVLNGKNVTVVMELQARFDEEANIKWSRKLEESGATLITTIPGMKVHSKLCLITRRNKGQKENFAAISTGNFNESTAKIYTDHVLFTNHEEITREVKRVFDMLAGTFRSFRFSHLMVSPAYLRRKIGDLINNEIKNAKAGMPSFINMKLNNVMDKAMTDRLYKASQAGVKIRLIVRGTCSVIPGIPEMSENIEIHSIVDKFLEHSRIYWFCNGGDEKVYIASADMMVRNLDRRVEVAVPIYQANIKSELKQYFEMQWKDNQKSRFVNHSDENKYVENDGQLPVRFQADYYEYLKNKGKK